MASTPDPHPDSLPGDPSTDVERVSPGGEPGRESVEDVPGGDNSVDSPGMPGGTAGTGDSTGDNKVQGDLAR